MLDAGAFVSKHRAKGVFIDTNLLVLLLVGLVNIRRIGTFKRTLDFTVDDFHLLIRLTKWFGSPIFSTPHVLSQVSDLTDLTGQELIAIRMLFKRTIATVEEQYDPARVLVDDLMFERFGLRRCFDSRGLQTQHIRTHSGIYRSTSSSHRSVWIRSTSIMYYALAWRRQF
jgi:hypothetical protein